MDKLFSLIPSIAYNKIDIINIVISTVIAILVSYAISWYFFKRGGAASRMASYMTHEMARMNLKQQLPQFFSQQVIHGTLSKAEPKASDVPVLTEALIYPAPSSKSVSILCAVQDEGGNFPKDGITSSTDGKVWKDLTYVAYGYWTATIDSLNAANEKHVVWFKLCDNKNNQNDRSVTFYLKTSYR